MGFALTHPEPHDPLGAIDFWPTPAWVTRLLVDVHPPPAALPVYEPQAGEGGIAGVLVQLGYEVHALELREECRDKLAGCASVTIGDFLTEPPRDVGQCAIVCNPPYSMPAMLAHMQRAMQWQPVYLAAHLPLAWSCSRERLAFNLRNPPSGVYPLAERVSFSGDGKGGSRDTAWYVWDERMQGAQRYEPLSKAALR